MEKSVSFGSASKSESSIQLLLEANLNSDLDPSAYFGESRGEGREKGRHLIISLFFPVQIFFFAKNGCCFLRWAVEFLCLMGQRVLEMLVTLYFESHVPLRKVQFQFQVQG